jgi:gluconolactonase
MARVSDVSVLVSGYDSPEGPCFDRDGNLYFVNWLSSSIVRLTQDRQASEWFNTGGIPAGLAFDPDGNLYVADEGDQIHGVLRITPDKRSEILVNTYEGKPLNGANDLVFDRNGVLYFSDPWGSSSTSDENPIGGFYRLFPDGRLERLDHGLAFPNGVAVAADGSAVYLAETGRRRILRYPIAADGLVGPREHWADVPGPPGPDGMAFDERGYLYVAHYSGGRVAIFAPDGTLADEISVPGKQVTNCAFGGPEGKTLVITDVDTASLYRVELDVAGQRLYSGV